MRITNADVQKALAAMTHICCTGNRLDSLPAARAYRIKEALEKASASVEAVRVQLCKDHGQLSEDGSAYRFKTAAAVNAYSDGMTELLAEQRDIDLETLTPEEIDGGWFRTADGKRDKFDLSPEQRGILTRVGIIAERKEAE